MSRKIDFEKQPEYIRQMAHGIGLEHEPPYMRHGKRFYRPYRNYFSTVLPDEVWAAIEYNGWAAHGRVQEHDGRQSCVYWLTSKGLDHLGKVLGITIHDCQK